MNAFPRQITITRAMWEALKSAYDIHVCGNGAIGGKWEGWSFTGDGFVKSPDGDVFSTEFLRMVGREFAIRGTPLTKRRSKAMDKRALRQDLSAIAHRSREE
jgi:hypothetical protein